MPNLLQIQGTGKAPTYGRATFSASPTIEVISHYWCWLCQTHFTKTGNSMQQNYNKGLYCYFCLFCYKGNSHWGYYKPHHWSIPCRLETLHSAQRKTTDHLFQQWYNLSGCSQPAYAIYDMLRSSSEMTRVQDLRHRVAKNGADKVPYVTVVSLYSWIGLSVEYLHKILCKSLSSGWTTIWRYILTISVVKHTWWVLNRNTIVYKSGWTVAPTWSMSFSDNPFKVLALPSKTTLVYVVELVSLKTGWWGRK
jgi:hypothetical protein